jgi:hypothetical protein
MSPRICLFILTSLLKTIHEAAIVPTGYRAQGSLKYGQSNDRPRSPLAGWLWIDTNGDDAYDRRIPAAVAGQTVYHFSRKSQMQNGYFSGMGRDMVTPLRGFD